MTDLNSPSVQHWFKRMKRLSLVTRITMFAVTILSGALAIWTAVKIRRIHADWAELAFIILLCVACLCFIGIIVWTVFINKPHSAIICRYVSENFYQAPRLLKDVDGAIEAGATPTFSINLAGDKVAVFSEGGEGYVQIDLSPIKDYPTVCADLVAKTKRFLIAYCAVKAQGGGVTEAVICDCVGKVRKPRAYPLTEGDRLPASVKNSYFIKQNLIS